MNTAIRHLTALLNQTRTLLALVLMVVAFVVLSARPAMAAPSLQEVDGQTVLVQFAEGTTTEMRDAAIAEMGGELVVWMAQIRVAEVHMPLEAGVAVASVPSAANGIITNVEGDPIVEGLATFNDPDFSDAAMSYGLTQVDAMDAWKVITGSQEIVIAVVDTGIKLDHPEFAGRLVAGYDFVNNDDQADDDMGHGTHVAGIIAAGLDNGQGVAGVCPNCRLMPVKVLNDKNIGSWSQVAQGVLFAADNGASVINLSLGATVSSSTLAAAVQYALDKGVIVVAAAGNNGSDVPFYPAALDGVIAVGATTNEGTRWSRSNFGSYIDLVAPGSLIYSTYNDLNNIYGGYTYMSGTSMAAPFVSGVAALLLSANRNLTAQEVLDAMVAGAEDLGDAGKDNVYGYGQVSALGSLMSPSVGLNVDFGQLTEQAPEVTPVATPAPAQAVMIFLPALNR